MKSANNFIVLNIREYLENDDRRLGEDQLLQLLSEFSCPLNPDVERFLYPRAQRFPRFIGARGHIRAITLANHNAREYKTAVS